MSRAYMYLCCCFIVRCTSTRLAYSMRNVRPARLTSLAADAEIKTYYTTQPGTANLALARKLRQSTNSSVGHGRTSSQ
ncbi:hypothetical protein FOXG_16066 [Fusarium oxysporum f. sp. lycopersici 4287]|uniref:Uncharacterized protein n=2 Tax=Fusarium oxysporum TaxID=5507 RepID=A0A0J9W6W1_FUSO4|nr:uncharacterized protein FOXG_16066 [Fusarium oxysporum f. sp. lycopersici 4287]KNB18411.1 hypothetical protein FOXG_16066 [Fusarium oxysporum f. sp. lycopersici 4287]